MFFKVIKFEKHLKLNFFKYISNNAFTIFVEHVLHCNRMCREPFQAPLDLGSLLFKAFQNGLYIIIGFYI